MLVLYPDIKPYLTAYLTVDNPHEIYYEECGNPQGIPVLFVHGGPGGGCNPADRCFFDPEKYRIILFDQRGAGRSRPHAELLHNNTQALIADMEALRETLGVEQWLLFGGSWGSTLSLLYAQAHPERVLGLILRGIFLCRQKDIDWFYQGGAAHVFPDYWQHFLKQIPEAEQGNLLSAYYQRLTSSNELAQMAAAKAWSQWEAQCATLRPNHELVDNFTAPHVAVALARIETHYFMHDSFIEEDQILKQMDKISHLPGIIVHGRYDMVCPLDNAVALYDRWPEAELKIIRDAGHASREPGTVDALVRATMEFAERITKDLTDPA
ncbi:prolyl aminopeptidase [Halioxenophilus sp. WMMB6]|uniref:prolyl aminopeptidase n=1 Tax=Halioxenophilus sp. WMMB6 TaxID=3073815 RepID=UPI00295E2F51|nr:prolyl aminopeptidase [Halioxenophilus sp. WMMB6]